MTCVHKANIMKLGDGLFLNTFRRVAEEYKSTGIEYNDMIVDNTYDVPFADLYASADSPVHQVNAVGRSPWPVRRHGHA